MKWQGLVLGLALCGELFSMTAQTTRVVLYRRGEAIGGEEFLAANEQIVDYLATLPRPTQGLKGFKYDCQVKGTTIAPSVTSFGGNNGNNNNNFVYVTMIYELRDCVAVP